MIEVERQGAIEGWTANETQKALRDAWSGEAGDQAQFVDRSGCVWENAQYLQMLTRTTSQRVYNDSYADSTWVARWMRAWTRPRRAPPSDATVSRGRCGRRRSARARSRHTPMLSATTASPR